MSNWERIVEGRWKHARVTRDEPLAGDASTRRYVRLHLTGEDAPCTVVALIPHDSAPETSQSDFISVQRYLIGRGVAVPALLGEAEDGVLLLEDLGDVSLAGAVLEREASAEALLAQAADVAARIAASVRAPDPSCVAFTRSHRALIAEEIHLIAAYGLADGRPESREIDAELGAALARLADDLSAQPEVLIHRDYHAWNLHVDPSGTLRVIDFQDAMLGPALYDLASLCTDRDSARFIDAEREAALLDRFASALRREGVELDRDPAAYRRDYFTAVAFRALRVIGRFRHLAVEAGRPAHLRFLPMVAAQARRALEELDDRVLLRVVGARSAQLA